MRTVLILFIALLTGGIIRTLVTAQPPGARATVTANGRDVTRVVEPQTKQAVKIVADPAKPTPTPTPAVEPTFTAQGGFENSAEKARQSAVHAAKDRFRDYLLALDEPIDREPSTELVRQMLLPDQEQVQQEAIKSPTSSGTETMYRVTVAVKVQNDHLRTMRTRSRSSEALGVIGLGAVVLFATAGFFRLDAMTKGYVTTWLLLGTAGAGALLLGLWAYAWPW